MDDTKVYAVALTNDSDEDVSELQKIMDVTANIDVELVKSWTVNDDIESALNDMMDFCELETSIRYVFVSDINLIEKSAKGYDYWKNKFGNFDIEITTPELGISKK